MTLIELLNAANAGYPDGDLEEYYDPKTGNFRDGDDDSLALFIVCELMSTFEKDAGSSEQLSTALDALHTAIDELMGVINALEDLDDDEEVPGDQSP